MQDILTSMCLLSQRFVHGLIKFLSRVQTMFDTGIRGLNEGFWLGILSDATCKKITKKWYSGKKSWYAGSSIYMSDEKNRLGLHPAQIKPFESHFSKAKTVLVYGAGGGREVYALEKQGYLVHGIECNQSLVNYGNDFLAREGLKSRIEHLPPDLCPEDPKEYDGIIIGAGVIINVIPREKRIEFLRQMGSKLKDSGRMLIGLCCRNESSTYFSLIQRTANFIRTILRRRKLDLGDRLDFAYEHYFTKAELASELGSAGFEMIYFDDEVSNRSQTVAQKKKNN